MHLDGKVNASVGVVSGVPQSNVFGPLLIFYTSELFHIVGNHIAGYADDTTIQAVIINLKPLSRPQVMDSLHQDLAAINLCV